MLNESLAEAQGGKAIEYDRAQRTYNKMTVNKKELNVSTNRTPLESKDLWEGRRKVLEEE